MLRRVGIGAGVLALIVGLWVSAGAAAGKILVVALAAPDLMRSYLTNAGYSADEYTLVTTQATLEEAWQQRDQYAALVFAYHEMQNSPASLAFFRARQDEYVAFVRNGGGVFSTVRDDPADRVLIEPFDVSYSAAGSYTAQTFDIKVDHPIFRGVDPKRLGEQIAPTPDPTFVDSGLSSQNPDIPIVATMPGSDDPAIAAGTVGKGRVVFGGAELFWQDFVNLKEHLKLVRNVIDWVRGS